MVKSAYTLFTNKEHIKRCHVATAKQIKIVPVQQ